MILCATDDFWRPFVAMIERFGAYGVLRASIAQYLHHARSVEETLQLIDTILPAARAAESRGV